MTTHASMTGPSRARRGLTALVLLPLLLVLAGCFRLDMGLTINEDDTLDVSMEVADLSGMATRDDLDCADLESEITDAPADVEFTVEEIEDEDGNLGCRMVATGAPIDSMTGDGMSIEKVDDTYVFTFEGDETGMDTGSMEDMPAGMEPEVSISVTFPGEVIEADGEIDGNTVTWSGIEAFTAGGSATGEATGSGSSAGGVDTWVWVVLGVVALGAIAALVILITKKSRGSRPAAGAAPYGGPASPYSQGQPGQVPNEPGPGFPAQAGASQPQGGFGPSHQVPADPGPGYPGDQNPPATDPATTALTDTPVDRPEGSPFSPPPAPPAQPGSEDEQR
ncbi:hypothetical protein FHE66_00270 [Georgenia sp. 311]|uniref:LppM domain-containing protein n=1 Tax=Georgenia wutianyii TaxID=2585135 RepID=A0ABX5VQV1_9MICO|nr:MULTISPECIES: hypothetical protein [Georgenia]QDB80428.1 hypothetical protein FE251_14370 [Georgenia wutianyii]TNC21387.1 hypothetical protein FHE66_00270 [Georgenia sp. 311]